MGKIRNVGAHWTSDLATCAVAYLAITTCPGGRPKVEGLVCPHCGTDTSRGDCDGVLGFTKREAS